MYWSGTSASHREATLATADFPRSTTRDRRSANEHLDQFLIRAAEAVFLSCLNVPLPPKNYPHNYPDGGCCSLPLARYTQSRRQGTQKALMRKRICSTTSVKGRQEIRILTIGGDFHGTEFNSSARGWGEPGWLVCRHVPRMTGRANGAGRATPWEFAASACKQLHAKNNGAVLDSRIGVAHSAGTLQTSKT